MTADRRAALDALAKADAPLLDDIDTTAVKRRAALVEKVAKEICREKCAFYGEPPCWDIGDDYVQTPWPPDCGEPGCFALAAVAIEEIERSDR